MYRSMSKIVSIRIQWPIHRHASSIITQYATDKFTPDLRSGIHKWTQLGFMWTVIFYVFYNQIWSLILSISNHSLFLMRFVIILKIFVGIIRYYGSCIAQIATCQNRYFGKGKKHVPHSPGMKDRSMRICQGTQIPKTNPWNAWILHKDNYHFLGIEDTRKWDTGYFKRTCF